MSLQVVPKDLRNLRACLLCSLVKVWFAWLWVWCWSSRFCWLIPFFRFSCLLLHSCVIKVTTQSSGWLFCHCCGSAWHRIRERERERERERAGVSSAGSLHNHRWLTSPAGHRAGPTSVPLPSTISHYSHSQGQSNPKRAFLQMTAYPQWDQWLQRPQHPARRLKSLESWAKELSMQFNATKCNIMPGMVPVCILLLLKQHHHPGSLHQPVPRNPTLWH